MTVGATAVAALLLLLPGAPAAAAFVATPAGRAAAPSCLTCDLDTASTLWAAKKEAHKFDADARGPRPGRVEKLRRTTCHDEVGAAAAPATVAATAVTRRGWLGRASAAAAGAAAASVAALSNPRPAAAAESATLDSPAAAKAAAANNAPRTHTPSALCDPTVSSWRRGERVVHVLGTAHISSSSADLAGRLVREVRPDAVFVELDAKRIGRATGRSDREQPRIGEIGPTAWNGGAATATAAATATTAFDPFGLKEKMMKASSDAVGGAIRDLYKKLEAEGFSAGEEFVVAVREGLAVGSTIVLGDRDVDVTMKRLTEALARTDLKKLISADIDMERDLQDQLPDSVREWQEKEGGQFDAEQLRVFVETLKTKENVKKIMGTFREAAPEIYTAMVAERDEFMADGLNRLNQFGSIVAVMGIAHTEGVEAYLQGAGWRPLPVKC